MTTKSIEIIALSQDQHICSFTGREGGTNLYSIPTGLWQELEEMHTQNREGGRGEEEKSFSTVEWLLESTYREKTFLT